MNRPAFNTENLPANMISAMAAAALRKWVWVSPDTGTAFWLNEDTAKAKFSKLGGELHAPEAE